MKRLLHNYLRGCRRRVGLSQSEVAFLLGNEAAAPVSRHEAGERLPTLELALAYEILYGTPVKELFGGVSERIQAEMGARARILLAKVEAGERRGARERVKIELLTGLLEPADISIIPSWDEA